MGSRERALIFCNHELTKQFVTILVKHVIIQIFYELCIKLLFQRPIHTSGQTFNFLHAG